VIPSFSSAIRYQQNSYDSSFGSRARNVCYFLRLRDCLEPFEREDTSSREYRICLILPGERYCFVQIPFTGPWEKEKAGVLEATFVFSKETRLPGFDTSGAGDEVFCDAIFSESIGGTGNFLPILEKNSPIIRIKRREKAIYRMRRWNTMIKDSCKL
jgi:hypothetical protein